MYNIMNVNVEHKTVIIRIVKKFYFELYKQWNTKMLPTGNVK